MTLPRLGDIRDPATAENLRYMDEHSLLPDIGSIILWPTLSPPPAWKAADHSAISRVNFPELFSVFGTSYGTGDGSTTFNLPDMAGTEPLAQQTWIVRCK